MVELQIPYQIFLINKSIAAIPSTSVFSLKNKAALGHLPYGGCPKSGFFIIPKTSADEAKLRIQSNKERLFFIHMGTHIEVSVLGGGKPLMIFKKIDAGRDAWKAELSGNLLY